MSSYIFERRNGKSMEIAGPKLYYDSIIKRIEKLIWDYLDDLKFDCDGMEIEFEVDMQSHTIEVQIKGKDGCLYPYKLVPFAQDFSCALSARMIAEQFITAYSRRLELTNKIKQAFSNYKKENARYVYAITNYLNNKEDNKMAKFNIDTCGSFYTDAPAPKTAEQVEYEQKLLTLQRTMEDEVKAAKDKYAVAVDALNKERSDAKRIAEEDKAARNRKDRYDALVRAGFTEEQAWKMLMQDLGA